MFWLGAVSRPSRPSTVPQSLGSAVADGVQFLKRPLAHKLAKKFSGPYQRALALLVRTPARMLLAIRGIRKMAWLKVHLRLRIRPNLNIRIAEHILVFGVFEYRTCAAEWQRNGLVGQGPSLQIQLSLRARLEVLAPCRSTVVGSSGLQLLTQQTG